MIVPIYREPEECHCEECKEWRPINGSDSSWCPLSHKAVEAFETCHLAERRIFSYKGRYKSNEAS